MEASDVAVSLLIGTLFVYGVGIAVPTLVRFVFYKKPMSKGAAIGLLVVWWFIMFSFILFLKGGNQPHTVPLFIVLLISYYILRKEDKKNLQKQQIVNNHNNNTDTFDFNSISEKKDDQ